MPAPASRAPVTIAVKHAVVGFVVAEVQGGVAEVGQQVEVGDVGAGVQRCSQRCHGGRPVVRGGAGEA